MNQAVVALNFGCSPIMRDAGAGQRDAQAIGKADAPM